MVNMAEKIAFIGLGVMGFPMAGFLAEAGHKVTVYNRTTTKSERWVKEYGSDLALSPKDAALGADYVFACVGNDEDLRSVTTGNNGAFSGMSPGTIFIDHTTASAKVARELSELAKKMGCTFIDAPVSGGQAGAEKGVLTVMIGGDKKSFDKAKPLVQNYAKMIKLLGPVGYGQLTKMVNQICIAGILQGLAEGIHFAKVVGLDVEDVIETISKGAAQSWQMDNRYKTMNENFFEYGFAVDWMRKDLAIALDEGRARKAHLPVTALVDQFYSEVQSLGGSRWDTSSLIARLDSMNK